MRVEGKFVSRRKAIKFVKVCKLQGCSFEQKGRWWVVLNPNLQPHDDVPSANVRSNAPVIEGLKGEVKLKQPPKLARSGKGKHVYKKGTGTPIEMHFDGKGVHYLLA